MITSETASGIIKQCSIRTIMFLSHSPNEVSEDHKMTKGTQLTAELDFAKYLALLCHWSLPKDRNSKCSTCFGPGSLQEIFYWASAIPLCSKYPHVLQMKSSILNLPKSSTGQDVNLGLHSRLHWPDQSWFLQIRNDGKNVRIEVMRDVHECTKEERYSWLSTA